MCVLNVSDGSDGGSWTDLKSSSQDPLRGERMRARTAHQEARHVGGHKVRAGHGNCRPCACSACSPVIVGNDIVF